MTKELVLHHDSTLSHIFDQYLSLTHFSVSPIEDKTERPPF
jgi:hypothetical protein